MFFGILFVFTINLWYISPCDAINSIDWYYKPVTNNQNTIFGNLEQNNYNIPIGFNEKQISKIINPVLVKDIHTFQQVF